LLGILTERHPARLRVDVGPGHDRGCGLVEPPLRVDFASEVLGVLLAGLVAVASRHRSREVSMANLLATVDSALHLESAQNVWRGTVEHVQYNLQLTGSHIAKRQRARFGGPWTSSPSATACGSTPQQRQTRWHSRP
jgi:hypothetical protein